MAGLTPIIFACLSAGIAQPSDSTPSLAIGEEVGDWFQNDEYDPRELRRCYELGCSAYLSKPVQYSHFVEVIKRLGMFLETIKPPPIPVNSREAPRSPT
jgi:hypothetical protein